MLLFLDKVELGEKDLRALLRRHREKRKHQPVSVHFSTHTRAQFNLTDLHISQSIYALLPTELRDLNENCKMVLEVCVCLSVCMHVCVERGNFLFSALISEQHCPPPRKDM